VQSLRDLIAESESWLVAQVLAYARERGYTKYTSTLEEAWRASIAGLSAPLMELLGGNGSPRNSPRTTISSRTPYPPSASSRRGATASAASPSRCSSA